MNGKKLVLVVACAMVDPDGRVLIAQRPQGKTLAGLWEFPGGKVEPGESVEGALRRELLEEIGFSPQHFEPLTVTEHDYADRTVRLHAMIARVGDGVTVRNLGVTEHRWVPLPALPTYDWPQANTPIAAALARRLGGPEAGD